MSDDYKNNNRNDSSSDNLSHGINQAKDIYDTGTKIADFANARKNGASTDELALNGSPNAGNIGKPISDSGKTALDATKQAGSELGSAINSANTGTALSAGTSAGAGASATTGGTVAATATAAGAPTAGIGAAIVLALAGISMGIKEVDEIIEGKPPKVGTLPLIIFLLSTIGIIFTSFITSVPKSLFNTMKDTVWESFEENMPSTAEGVELIVSILTGEDVEKKMFFEEILEGTEYEGYSDEVMTTQCSFDAANLFIYEKIIDKAIIDALNIHCTNIIKDPTALIKHLFTDYDALAAMNQFLQLPYPYCLEREDGGKWTIEDAIKNKIPENELNNDLNYLEIITVLCQNESISLDGFTFSKFYDLICDEDISKYLYEMEMDVNNPFYFYFDDNGNIVPIDDIESYKVIFEEQEKNLLNAEYNISVNVTGEKAILKPYKFFYEVKVYPYGLKELYAIADVDYMDYNFNDPYIRNHVALAKSETWAATYLEQFTYTGISCLKEKNQKSLWYSLLKERLGTEPTGRSPYSYVDISVRDIILADYGVEIWDLQDPVSQDAYLTITGDSVILDIPRIIKQGNYKDVKRGDGRLTIAEAACIDCSYMMLVEYYGNKTFSVPTICRDYVKGQSFQYGKFLIDNNSVLRKDHASFSIQEIRNSITEGKPVVFHLKGVWKYNGITYHKTTNNHYILITGYDEIGFYVHDPGSLNGTKTAIPYKAFDYVDEKWVTYTSYNEKTWIPKYKINTLLENQGETE